MECVLVLLFFLPEVKGDVGIGCTDINREDTCHPRLDVLVRESRNERNGYAAVVVEYNRYAVVACS